MKQKKLRNIAFSLGILALWAGATILLSAKANSDAGNISVLYIWARLSGLIAGFGGLLFIALRIFKAIGRDHNFLYVFLGTANLVLGLGGVCFYFLHKINILGLHDLLPNLLIGVTIMVDLFLYEYMFGCKKSQ